MFSLGIARAQEPAQELTPVTVIGTQTPELTQVGLDKSSPQSLVTRQAIEQIASPFSDFGTLANFTPSFLSSAPNGNGFDAAKNMTLRGFPDGQFNVTLDGIPFADPDGFTHHSTSFFPAASIDHMVVDRGPGSGTDIGYATIGGSINIATLEIPTAAAVNVYGSYGSFATSQLGVRMNTATPTESGQTGVLLNAQHIQSDGAMSYADGRRDDAMLKAESLIGTARLTLLYSYDQYHFNNPPSVTTAQIAQFGSGFGFTDTPNTPTYYGYADTDRSSDFGYARLQTGLTSAVQLTETLYTYSFKNSGLSLKGDATSSPVGPGFGVPANDIAGRLSDESYRTVGDVLQLDYAAPVGVLRGGLWIEHSHQDNYRNAVDLTTGAPYNANSNADSPVLFDYTSELDTVEPFAEYDWNVGDNWILRAGLRYQSARRGFDASVVPNSLPGTNGNIERTVRSTLPSLEANYAFQPATHAYLQWSNGALVPNQSFFYTSNPAAGNQAHPETSRAFQAGVVHATDSLNLAADAYLIYLSNYVSEVTVNGNTSYINDGSVRYRGVEFEGNCALGAGLSVAANASIMRAQYQNSGIVSPAQQAGDSIPLVPNYLALAGLLYAHGPWSGSVLTKFVGPEYQGKNGSSDGLNFRVAAYSYTNLTISHTLDQWVGPRHAQLRLQVNNIENKTLVTDVAGPSVAGPLLVNVLARRNYLVSISADL